MNVLLIDVDSKIPNLALMKLSAYHKSIGDAVGFKISEPDIIYASIIFKRNKHALDGLKFVHPKAEIIIGGSGYDVTVKLPEYIDELMPDYSLYPEHKNSLGFSTRGCNRNCYFCIVTQKEGLFKIQQHPSEWHNLEYDTIVFLDNNILYDKQWFFEVTQWCIDNELAVEFNQGFDIRLVDESVAKRINEIKLYKTIKFAWDNICDEQLILDEIELLKDAGFSDSKLRNSVQIYVYVDSDDEFDGGLYRCNKLKSMNCNPFVMYNIDNNRTQRIKDLQRWANNKFIFWSSDFKDYSKAHNGELNQSLNNYQ